MEVELDKDLCSYYVDLSLDEEHLEFDESGQQQEEQESDKEVYLSAEDSEKTKEPEEEEEEDLNPRPRKRLHLIDESSDEDGPVTSGEKTAPEQETNEVQRPPFISPQKEILVDNRGKAHIKFSRTGGGYIFLASAQLSPSTCQEHCEDIKIIMKDNPEYKKPVLILISDDGDDYGQRSVLI